MTMINPIPTPKSNTLGCTPNQRTNMNTKLQLKHFDYEVITNIASNYDRGRMSKVFNLAQGKSVVRVCKPYNLEGQEVREYPLADFQSAIDFYNS